jgi:hypothetical protein
MYECELTGGRCACATCDNYDKCDSILKDMGNSVYCTKFKLKYGCEWVYRKSRLDKKED